MNLSRSDPLMLYADDISRMTPCRAKPEEITVRELRYRTGCLRTVFVILGRESRMASVQ
jgi:hypothetical protein